MTIDKLDDQDLRNILQDIQDEDYYIDIQDNKKKQKMITIGRIGDVLT